MAAITNINDLDFSKVYSYADYLTWQLSERLELIKGKIFQMSPAPSRIHQRRQSNLVSSLFRHFDKHPCQIYLAPFDVRLPDSKKSTSDKQIFTVVQPDICVICDLSKLDDRGCVGAPELVVEILSPGNSKTEMKNKFRLYEESGVKEYWIVEPANQTVFVYVLQNGQFIGLAPFTDEDILKSKAFPNLEVDLNEVFAD